MTGILWTMRRNLKIERAQESDLTLIMNLLKETNLPPDGIESHLKNFLFIKHREVATGSESIVGSVGLEIYGKLALLRSFAVHPYFQRTGLG
jgi:amino-acid N-acetyltransferase